MYHVTPNENMYTHSIFLPSLFYLISLRHPTTRLGSRPLLLQLPLSIPIILRRINAMLIMVHKIKPGQHMQENPRVPALPTRHTLHILRHRADPIQRLPAFHFIRHFAHVHLDLAPVLGEAIEAVDAAGVEEEEAGGEGDGAGETHDGGEAGFADFGGGDALPPEHEGGAAGGEDGAGGVVRAAGVADYASEVRIGVDELARRRLVLVLV